MNIHGPFTVSSLSYETQMASHQNIASALQMIQGFHLRFGTFDGIVNCVASSQSLAILNIQSILNQHTRMLSERRFSFCAQSQSKRVHIKLPCKQPASTKLSYFHCLSRLNGWMHIKMQQNARLGEYPHKKSWLCLKWCKRLREKTCSGTGMLDPCT